MADGVVYIKIAKTDKNGVDQTTTLQSLNQVTIPYSTGNITYEVINLTEHSTYFLYSVNPAGVEWNDRAEIKYNFTGSVDSTQLYYSLRPGLKATVLIPLTASFGDQSNFWDTTSGYYRQMTYPQKDVTFKVSGSFSILAGGDDAMVGIYRLTDNGNIEELYQQPSIFLAGTTQNLNLSFVVTSSLPSEMYAFGINGANANSTSTTCSFSNLEFFTISTTSTGPQTELIAEPYFGSNDFLRALDCQPLLNNVDVNRKHNLYQDVDYSAGATEPVNFDLLISGSAIRAEVQLSNYTTQRHTIPRYKGSKSTSQKLNEWSKKDTGTYGKSPTVESLKRAVIYTDQTTFGISGWPPERMNASTVAIRYLIDENGDITIPNTSENSLEEVQGTFQTGERVLISSKKVGGGEASAYRKIIRGGARIEPILYTQSGSAPNAQFNTTMSFEDIIPSNTGNVSNVKALFKRNTNQVTGPSTNTVFDMKVLYDGATLGNSFLSNNGYSVSSDVVDDGINLIFDAHIPFSHEYFYSSFVSHDITVETSLYKNASIIHSEEFTLDIDPSTTSGLLGSSPHIIISSAGFQNPITIPVTDINVGDEFFIFVKITGINANRRITFSGLGNSILNVSQYPLSSQPVTSSGYNSIWNWGDSNNYPYIITSSQPTLVDLYNETAKQTDILGSGFNPISLPFSVKRGDEFRFEGREDFTYMVSKVFGPSDVGTRVFSTGSIEVHFATNLPTGSSTDTLNLDNFLIRRYVDDASQVIIEGFKPTNSEGPYVVSPEYVVNKLNKSIDEYITILTEKSLLS